MRFLGWQSMARKLHVFIESLLLRYNIWILFVYALIEEKIARLTHFGI